MTSCVQCLVVGVRHCFECLHAHDTTFAGLKTVLIVATIIGDPKLLLKIKKRLHIQYSHIEFSAPSDEIHDLEITITRT